MRCWLRDGADSAAALQVLPATLEKLFRGELTNLKSGRRKEMYRVRGGDGVEYLLKVNHYSGWTGLRRGLRPSKARHELHVAQGVTARGLPTPVPLAVGEIRRHGILRQCFEWMPVLSDVCDLKTLWEQRESVSPAEWRAITIALGKLAHATAEAHVFQDDFAPNNILVRRGPTPQLFLIDFERAELRDAPLVDTEKRWMLAKLDRHLAGASAADRMRFLRAYCTGQAPSGGEREAMRRIWHSLRALMPLLAERDFARMQRKSAHAGRRYAEVSIGAWTGFAVQSRLDPETLAALLARETPNGVDTATPSAAAPHGTDRDHSDAIWVMRYPKMCRERAHALWSTANTLEIYGRLAPSPIALLQNDAATLLLFQKRPASLTLAEATAPTNEAATQLAAPSAAQAAAQSAAQSAARVLIDHLLAISDLVGALAPRAISLEPRAQHGAPTHTVYKALLLDVAAVKFSATPRPEAAEELAFWLAEDKAQQFRALRIEPAARPVPSEPPAQES